MESILSKRISITVVFILSLIKLGYSQSLQIISNQEESFYPVAEIQKITFQNDKATIHLKNDSTISEYNITEIQTMNFEEVLSQVDDFNVFTDQLILYPNPVSEVLTFRFESPDPPDVDLIQIFDLNGKLISNHSKNLRHTDEYSIPVSQLPNGVYLCVIHHHKSISTQKFIKK